MSLFRIALRSIQQRGIASLLTMLSMALGVMLVVAVLTIHGVVETSFRHNSMLGYNMIVGANKGGKEQLTLNTVYYLSQPVQNIPYEYYLEFLPQAERDLRLKESFRVQAAQLEQQAQELQATLLGTSGLPLFTQQATGHALHKLAEKRCDLGRPGKYSLLCEQAIPLCLGDYFGRFRVVGTTPAFFNDLVYDIENDKKYEFAQGRNFVWKDPTNSYFEAVVGAAVAREMNVNLGDKIAPQHGVPGGHTHERKFVVVGILKTSGTPNDRAVFINMEGFYLMNDHAKPVEEIAKAEAAENAKNGTTATDEPKPHLSDEELRAQMLAEAKRQAELEYQENPEPLPVEQREVTSLVVRSDVTAAIGLEYAINKGKDAQAALPAQVIYGMFATFIDPIRWVLLVLTAMICVVSGISILVSIYNSMSERRQEIAVMRALGAGRSTVMTIILLESVLLSLGGGLVGWFTGHLLCYLASPLVEAQTGVTVGFNLWGEPFFSFANGQLLLPMESVIVPGLTLLAVVVGIWPAVSAYNTDVSKSLGK